MRVEYRKRRGESLEVLNIGRGNDIQILCCPTSSCTWAATPPITK